MEASQRRELTQSVHRSSGSFELVGGSVLFALLGLLVDRTVGATPLFTVVFAVVGLTGATISLVYRYRAQMVDHHRERRGAPRGTTS